MNQSYWQSFTKASMLHMLDDLDSLQLSANPSYQIGHVRRQNLDVITSFCTCHKCRQKWSKAKLVDYMVEKQIKPIPTSEVPGVAVHQTIFLRAASMILRLISSGQLSDVNQAQAYRVTTDPFPKCSKHVADQIFKEGLTCSVCLDEISQERFTVSYCGHSYCKECFDKVKRITKSCALCKASFV